MSLAAERNKEPILDILKQYLSGDGRIFEIGTGNGIHATHFSKTLVNLHWITSDLKKNHRTIEDQLKKKQLSNIHGPEIFEVGKDDLPKRPFDYVYTANTLHIMPWKKSKGLFKLLGRRLREGCLVFIYGPFNYSGQFSAPSNEAFDKMLKEKDPMSGIRNFEDVCSGMEKFGFKLLKDYEMPVNNRLLVFERLPFKGEKT